MWQKTNGIVFNSIKHKEKSYIVKIYTRNGGLQSFYVNIGASAKKNGGVAHIQPLTLVEIEFSEKENLTLQRAKEIKISEPYKSIPFDVNKSAIIIFLQEVLCKSIIENTANENLFDFIWHSLLYYDLSEKNNNFHLAFLAKLLKYIGFLPKKIFIESDEYFDIKSGDYVPLKPFHSYYLEPAESLQLNFLFSNDYEEISTHKFSSIQRKLILQALIDFYIFHLQGFKEIKSLKILQEVFAS